MSFGPESTALVVLDPTAPEAAGALTAARRAAVLTILVRPAGTAHGGSIPHERVIVAHGGAAFHGSELDLLLRSNGVRAVLFAGGELGTLAMDARDAMLRGYRAGLVLAQEDMAPATTLLHALFTGAADRPDLLPMAAMDQIWAGPDGMRSWQVTAKRNTLLPTLADRLDPGHTAFVLIDVQNDFCRVKRNPEESFAIVDRALPNIDALLARARETRCTIVHVQAEYGPLFRAPGQPYRYPGEAAGEVVWTAFAAEFGVNGPELPDDEVEVCLAGSWGEQFVGIEPQPGEIVLRKHRYSAFIDTGLEVILRRRGVRTIVLVGVATNVCVESTARDAAMHDFYVVVAGDACATRGADSARHDNALAEIRGCFGMVVPASRVLDTWRQHAAVPEPVA